MAIATNKAYIQQVLSGLNISEGDIDVILLKAGLTGTDTTDAKACDTAIYDRMSLVLKSVTQNVTEGGYSVSWNIDAVKAYYNALCTELEKPNVLFARPKIRNRSNMW